MDIIEKLRSQIGDDVQMIFDHEALFKDAVLEIERLRAALSMTREGVSTDEAMQKQNLK